MNDDELIQRLRRTFREQAEGLRPGPSRLPTGAGRHTAEYPGSTAAGPAAGGRPPRRRWPPVVGAGALVAAAAAASVAVALSGGRHPVTVRPADHGSAPVPPPQSTPVTAVQSPPATVAASPPSPTPTVAKGAPVAAGFQPESVTFVSPEDGWSAGTASDRCLAMARTTDGGRTWSDSGAPQITAACGPGDGGSRFQVRFADTSDGWVYSTAGPSSTRGVLWSTHDGGATWRQQVPLEGGAIGALEASSGQVQMVVYGPCRSGSPGCQGQTVEQILTSPVHTDDWRASALSPSIGAGPVLSPALTLWGTSGWLINDNRTVASGARLSSNGWTAWTPPCSSAGGAGLTAAASATDLVAVCAEGMWGTPDAGTTAGSSWLFRSSDGGRSFAAVGAVPGNQPDSVSTPPGTPTTVVLADGIQGLQATFDGGAHWSTIEPGQGPGGASRSGYVFDYVGFTTATQGVAVATEPSPALFVTRDGGHTWSPAHL